MMTKPMKLPPGAEEAAARWLRGEVDEEQPSAALIAGLALALGGQAKAAGVLGCSPTALRAWVAGTNPLPDRLRWGGMLWWSRKALGAQAA